MEIIKQNEDFGKKIGGARKDLWNERGLSVEDLRVMNAREAEKHVKKDNVWKKPDYAAMITSGIPLDIVYFIKKVRDSLNVAPLYSRMDDTPEKRFARQRQYIDTVREVQSVMESTRTIQDVLQAYDRFFIANGYVEKSTPYYPVITAQGRQNSVLTNKLKSVLQVSSELRFQSDFTRNAQKEQFGVSSDEKVPKGYGIKLNDGKTSYSNKGDWLPNTYFVTRGYTIMQTNFLSRDAALAWAQNHAAQQQHSGKKRFVPKQLMLVQRGGADFRGEHDISGEDYLKEFSFKGGEFGNWMTQNDRQGSLNMGFDALKDLAIALQINDKDISYQGELSIAFGSRGSGNAVAHYEPLRKVINLTKMHGAGSLAHEWWHGLDDFLGNKMGTDKLLSENPRLYPLMQKLLDIIKYKPQTQEQAVAQAKKQLAATQNTVARWIDSLLLPSVQRTGDAEKLKEYAVLKDTFLSGKQDVVTQLNDFKKAVTGHVIPKSDRDTLHTYVRLLSSMAEQDVPRIGRVETDYFLNSQRMGREYKKDGDYWEGAVEMTARAFACYVMDRLPYRSDYLCGHAECAVAPVLQKDGSTELLRAYPQGEERKAINAVFDEIVADLKLQHILSPALMTEKTFACARLSQHSVGAPMLSIPKERQPHCIDDVCADAELLAAQTDTGSLDRDNLSHSHQNHETGEYEK